MDSWLLRSLSLAQGIRWSALSLSILSVAISTGVSGAVPLGSSSSFSVLGGTTVTNDGPSLIKGNLGVSPGSAITGFQPVPLNTILGPGTVTGGLGLVDGTIYAGGAVAAQAHNDAVIAYNYLVSQVPTANYVGVTQLDGLIFTPGVYHFAPSANLQVNGQLYLDFQGNNDALFIFQTESTLVAMAGSNIIALNSSDQSCAGSNVFWAVGSSATIDGVQFIGTVIAHTTITMTTGVSVSGRMLALNGAVTMINDSIGACAGTGTPPPPPPCRDYVTGGGCIEVGCHGRGRHRGDGRKATFGVSGGIKDGQFWGELSFNDHKGVKLKGTEVTAYIVIDKVTRQIEGMAMVDGTGLLSYTVVIVDNGGHGRNDKFSIHLSNGYALSGKLDGGNIRIYTKCGDREEKHKNERCDDEDEKNGHDRCDNDRDWQ